MEFVTFPRLPTRYVHRKLYFKVTSQTKKKETTQGTEKVYILKYILERESEF
jgi:hypothetical protein